MTKPLWFAGRLSLSVGDSADVINWTHPDGCIAWTIEVLVDETVPGSQVTVDMGSTTRHAPGALQLTGTTGATGKARFVFGAQGDSGTVRVTANTGGSTSVLSVSASVLEVTSLATGSNVTTW